MINSIDCRTISVDSLSLFLHGNGADFFKKAYHYRTARRNGVSVRLVDFNSCRLEFQVQHDNLYTEYVFFTDLIDFAL